MIRRDITTSSGQPAWLLISQVEHARLSGALASQWQARDLSPYTWQGGAVEAATREEIVAAIVHHDDGWAAWEAAPGIDPQHGRPYSFMSELPLGESLAIWDASIASAGAIGPLAAWMVARHFRELLATSESDHGPQQPLADQWIDTVDRRCADWLAQWQRTVAEPSPTIAQRALALLQATDVLSLWLCCRCPVEVDAGDPDLHPFTLHWPEKSVGPYRLTPQRPGRRTAHGWTVVAAPWPFTTSTLVESLEAAVLPVDRYQTNEELSQAQRAAQVGWELSPVE